MQNVAWAVVGVGFVILLGALYFLPLRLPENREATDASSADTMIIRSPAFNHEETIPEKYTCTGKDVSPPLAFDGLPANTVSLALIMGDPDAPNGTWDHWIVFNISPSQTRIGEGGVPEGMQGTNSWGRTGYGGPCPPSGEHRYLFKVFALDTALDLPEGATKSDILAAMNGHILESTTLMGRYQKPLKENK